MKNEHKLDKLTIYYEPAYGSYEYVKSFTFVLSRINPTDNTYKKKAILQHKSKTRNTIEEYEMMEMHTGVENLMEKIKKFDTEKEYSAPIEGEDVYCIAFNNIKIATSDRNEIAELLEAFNFDKLVAITHKHYQYIKDMDEYTKFIDIMNTKLMQLDGPQLLSVSQLFKQNDPNKLFENIHNLPAYLEIAKVQKEV